MEIGESAMRKVITYGTFDLLHYGHIRLLERAKELGDYLVVAVTADGFDRARGKINVRQSLAERMEAVRETGLADEVIVEEYEGQKIDDIRRLGIDVFAVGSDWTGHFDYLSEWCEVVYLDRTQGVSSSDIRSERAALKLGIIAKNELARKYKNEAGFVNGIEIGATVDADTLSDDAPHDLGALNPELTACDAVYIAMHPSVRSRYVRLALQSEKHVLCESPIAQSEAECKELLELASSKGLVLVDAIKTAYSTAYYRLLLLVKSGVIGQIVSIQSTCTSLADFSDKKTSMSDKWPSSSAWAPTALLPILHLLGTDYLRVHSIKCAVENMPSLDCYGKIELSYPDAVGEAIFGKAVKSEGELIIAGTAGYIYVPAPWWKTDYFELRKENADGNRRFFYQLDGEGIRYELVAFAKAVESRHSVSGYISDDISLAICRLIEEFRKDEVSHLLTPLSPSVF